MIQTAIAPSANQDSFKHKQPAPTIAPEGVFSLLIPELQRAIVSAGYVTPTPIQEQCIPHLIEGRDLMGTAQTGTGKTAAFALPLLQRLAGNSRRPQRGTPRALILAPTRELAAQIGAAVQNYGRFLRLSYTTVFGGVNQYSQVKALNRGVDILIATPGRLLDLMQQGYIRLNEVEVFILDEVDRMLDMGFMPAIEQVLAKLPAKRQTLFFSATMAPKMAELAYNIVTNPVRVTITPEQPTVERINQKVLFVGKNQKDALLVSLLDDVTINKAIVFTQMKHVANRVVEKLHTAGINCTAIHGNKSQSARTEALDGFKRGRFRVLVATDVAARGLDVDNITHVINYDLPIEAETYIHRIGRTGRAGADGDAISFCSTGDRNYLRDIEKLLGKPVETDLEHAFHSEEALRSTAGPVASRVRQRSGNGRTRNSSDGGNSSGSGNQRTESRSGGSNPTKRSHFAASRERRGRYGDR